jgi:type III secretion protein D
MTETMPHDHAIDLELRVLEGEQRGARTTIDATQAFVISNSLSSDVVLRGKAAAAFDVSIRLRSDKTRLHLWIRSGEVGVDGRIHRSGARFDVLLYTPLHIGGSVIALGRPGNPAWADLDDAARPTPAQAHMAQAHTAPAAEAAAAPAGEGTQAAAASPSDKPGWPAQLPRRLLLAGATLGLVSSAALVFAYAISPGAQTPAQKAERIEADLRAAGFAAVSVRADDGGRGWLVSGYLDTATERARLEQHLARLATPVRLSLWVNDSLASAVENVFRVNGAAAKAQAVGPGIVAVSTQTADLELLHRIQATARRDVPGLAELRLSNSQPRPTAPPVRVVDDPGKRIASIVPGRTPFVVTVDGTRYFEGALLPTGHRVVEIREREVLLDLNGLSTPLRF